MHLDSIWRMLWPRVDSASAIPGMSTICEEQDNIEEDTLDFIYPTRDPALPSRFPCVRTNWCVHVTGCNHNVSQANSWFLFVTNSINVCRGNINPNYIMKWCTNHMTLYIISIQLKRNSYTFYLDLEIPPFLSLTERC